MASTTTGGPGPLMLATREHGGEKMIVETRLMIMLMLLMIFAMREHECEKIILVEIMLIAHGDDFYDVSDEGVSNNKEK